MSVFWNVALTAPVGALPAAGRAKAGTSGTAVDRVE
jgi:hypothetical protein